MTVDRFTAVNALRPGRFSRPVVDLAVIVCIASLLLFGLLMVYSASIALPDAPRYANYGRYDFVLRHGVFMAIGVAAAVLCACVPLRAWQKIANPLFVLSLVLLIAVLVPGIGREVNGARRWLPLGGMTFQPSELMKIAILLYAADYTVRKQSHMKNVLRGFVPMACALGFVGLLLLLEPDLGACFVIVCVAFGVLFLGGISLKLYALLVGLLGSGFGLLIWLSPWRRARIFAYLDPWNPENVYGSAYQLSHSLIALGRGEWFGVGLGASVEKLHYLPEAHTDFIVSVIGEELGFVGVSALILAFAFIVWRAFEIGRQAVAMDRIYSGLVAQGVAIWLGVQTFINIGVCLGLLPTKGLTLPLVSYGGTALVMNLIACALLLRVDFENRSLMRARRT